MEPSNSKDVVRRFVNAINSHDAEVVVALLTSTHVFTDSLGNRLTGPANLLSGWRKYFQLFPDYSIHLETVVEHGATVAAFGRASATFVGAEDPSKGAWSIPAAWRAVVVDGKIAEWQVYADNTPVHEILRAAPPRL